MAKKISLKKIFLHYVFLSLVLFIFLSLFFSVRAANNLEVDYPAIGGLQPKTVETPLPEYVKYIFNFAILGVGLLFFGVLIRSGFSYLTSAGNAAKTKDARDRIFSALLGIIILFSSYLILTTINPRLIIFDPSPLLGIKRCASNSDCSANAMCKNGFCLPSSCDDNADCNIGSVCSNGLCVSSYPKQISSILTELPLGQAMENGIWNTGMWNKDKTITLPQLIDRITNFWSLDIVIYKDKDKTETSKTLNNIADLNKYLKNLTDECTCDKLSTICTKPENGAKKVGVTGDPCQGKRDEINNVLDRESYIMGRLYLFQHEIQTQKNIFQKELSNYQGVEEEMAICQEEAGGVFTLGDYLDLSNYYRENGWNLMVSKNYVKSGEDPLTFYCSVGGTAQDYYASPEAVFEESSSEITLEERAGEEEEGGEEGLSCPVIYPIGEVLDDARVISISTLMLLDSLDSLFGKMIDKIKAMVESVLQCNGTGCEANCSCFLNPCYKQYPPSPLSPFCGGKTESLCLQAIGNASAKGNKIDACPRDDLGQSLGDIKMLDDNILLTIKKLRESFPTQQEQQEAIIKDESLLLPEVLANINEIRSSIKNCYSDDSGDSAWELLPCDTVKNSVGPDGEIIQSCNPRNFFCCTSSKEALSKPPGSPVLKGDFAYKPPTEQYDSLLPDVTGCPQGWLCNPDAASQYTDASEMLKQVMACMRKKLDDFQGPNGVDLRKNYPNTPGILGRITSISDSRLYSSPPTCDWTNGPLKPEGCQHTYKKDSVSAHYGGRKCSFQKQSNAMDIGVTKYPYERIYGLEVQKIAQECNGFVLYLIDEDHKDHLHISSNQAYNLCEGH